MGGRDFLHQSPRSLSVSSPSERSPNSLLTSCFLPLPHSAILGTSPYMGLSPWIQELHNPGVQVSLLQALSPLSPYFIL